MSPDNYDYFLNLLGELRNIGKTSYNEEFNFLWNLLDNYKKNETCPSMRDVTFFGAY
jgi:hypothetical protein